MADLITSQTLIRFFGINNVDPATRLVPVTINHEYVYPLSQAVNVEIDNTFGLSSRPGQTSVKTGSAIHSLWSDNEVCFYVDDGVLNQMYEDYTVKALRTNMTDDRVSYARFNDRYYFTNGKTIGYIKEETASALVDPAKSYKKDLPPGQLIEAFKACLLVADGNILYISDPLCDYYDTRYGYKIFTEEIDMLRGVDRGVFVSSDRIWFMHGLGQDEWERHDRYPIKAIRHTDVVVSGKYVGDGLEGNVALWTCENGICVGTNDGQVTNVTEARYTFTPRGRGAGFIREKNNVRHYINSLY